MGRAYAKSWRGLAIGWLSVGFPVIPMLLGSKICLSRLLLCRRQSGQIVQTKASVYVREKFYNFVFYFLASGTVEELL